MMRSMYSAVSGLRIHQSKMDTIGNNIANVNTIGFKRGQVSFQEVFSQTVRGASAPQGGLGGTNPQQVGMGASIGSISTIHTEGNGQRTDDPTDLMISGEGFFVVSSDVNFDNRYYTRAGNFTLDRDGNLVTSDGYKVLGYEIDEAGNPTTTVTNMRINKSETKEPTATNKIVFEGNLDSNTPVTEDGKAGILMDTVIRDSLGNSYKLTFELKKTENDVAGNTWTMEPKRLTEVATGNYYEGNMGLDSVKLKFDSDGKLATIGGNDAESANISLGIGDITFDKNIDGDVKNEGKLAGTFSEIVIFDSEDPDTISNIHQYANETDLKPKARTGNTSGSLEGFSIDSTGTIVGSFTNGERKALGQIMLAKFDNNMGLEKIGGNFFIDTRNSGEAQLGTASTSGFGKIDPGTLEMSNVDLSLEFTEMITTQRGFQANSRVITTSDEMLQELVNLKR